MGPLQTMAGAEKLRDYQGLAGRAHALRDELRERWAKWRSSVGPQPPRPFCLLGGPPTAAPCEVEHDYSHIYRRKTRAELVRVSAAVMGLEFSYAAETAFVSPTLLQMRVQHRVMTLAWALSPLVGFFVTPVLGSVSDRCRLRAGRRRPFILLLGLGVLLGLLLVPNGQALGYWLGDPRPAEHAQPPGNSTEPGETEPDPSASPAPAPPHSSHPWGVLFTVLGTVLLDFDADACQSPARAYLLDVTVPEDHARGLSTFTVMAGLGGCLGYALGAVDWDSTVVGRALGGHVRAVFTLITFIFVGCVLTTITSFRELPLALLEQASVNASAAPPSQAVHPPRDQYKPLEGVNDGGSCGPHAHTYQGLGCEHETSFSRSPPQQGADAGAGPEADGGGSGSGSPTLRQYLLSIVLMPASLRVLCLTNLFCWMAHVCYSLYFTDYVGEAVFGGDPQAEEGTVPRLLYENGVRFGCWGMSMYSLSCACYSMIIERLIHKFRARRVYVGGLLVYACGMLLMALCRDRAAVLIFSWTAGVMYSTLFTMPYLLVARYHSLHTFEVMSDGMPLPGGQLRGLGTDVAIVSSMVFLAQLLLSCGMGTLVNLAGSTTAVVASAAVLSMCGAIAASQVMYLDL